MANDAGARYIMPVAVFIGGKAPAQPFAMMLQCLCSAAFLGHWTRENSSNISRMYIDGLGTMGSHVQLVVMAIRYSYLLGACEIINSAKALTAARV